MNTHNSLRLNQLHHFSYHFRTLLAFLHSFLNSFIPSFISFVRSFIPLVLYLLVSSFSSCCKGGRDAAALLRSWSSDRHFGSSEETEALLANNERLHVSEQPKTRERKLISHVPQCTAGGQIGPTGPSSFPIQLTHLFSSFPFPFFFKSGVIWCFAMWKRCRWVRRDIGFPHLSLSYSFFTFTATPLFKSLWSLFREDLCEVASVGGTHFPTALLKPQARLHHDKFLWKQSNVLCFLPLSVHTKQVF